jgi:hypothetical protein
MDHKEFLNGPIEHVVIFKTFAHERIAQEFAKIRVIRPLVKIQITGIFKVDCPTQPGISSCEEPCNIPNSCSGREDLTH